MRFLCSSLRASKASVAIYEFKRKFTFGLPRICTLALCKFSQWQIPCHTYKFFRIDLIFIIITALCYTDALAEVSKNPLHCHTERSEVSIKSKCDFSALRCILNSMDFSLSIESSKWQCLAIFASGFFAVAAPCNPLGRLFAKAQNGKASCPSQRLICLYPSLQASFCRSHQARSQTQRYFRAFYALWKF